MSPLDLNSIITVPLAAGLALGHIGRSATSTHGLVGQQYNLGHDDGTN